MAVVLAIAHDGIVVNVAEQHVAAGGEINRALRPAESGGDALDRHGAGEGREAAGAERTFRLLQRLDVRIRIDRTGQRSQGQRLALGLLADRHKARLAQAGGGAMAVAGIAMLSAMISH
jgi:hypothetical protein